MILIDPQGHNIITSSHLVAFHHILTSSLQALQLPFGSCHLLAMRCWTQCIRDPLILGVRVKKQGLAYFLIVF